MHRKRILWIAVLLCFFLAALALFVVSHYRKAPAEQPRTAAVVAVVRGNLASSLTVAGQFQPYNRWIFTPKSQDISAGSKSI